MNSRGAVFVIVMLKSTSSIQVVVGSQSVVAGVLVNIAIIFLVI